MRDRAPRVHADRGTGPRGRAAGDQTAAGRVYPGMRAVHRCRVADLRTAALYLCALATAGCGRAVEAAPEQGGAEPTTSCAERLAPLRQEMQWADEAPQGFDWNLASVPDWQYTAMPAHVIRWQFGALTLDDADILYFERVDEEVATQLREFPGSDEKEIRRELERDLERDLKAGLKAKLPEVPASSVAIAIEANARWEHVAPALRVLSRGDGTVRLVVDRALPPWWDRRVFDEASRDAKGIGELSHEFSLRAVEVFATCPTAVSFADAGPRMMEAYVDGIEACDCRVDLAAARELLHGIALPMIGSAGVVEITVVPRGAGAPFVAEPSATWAEVLPRLRAGSGPVVLPDVPEPPRPIPPPPPPPEPKPRKRRG
jgi:hypothetical protein